MAWASTMESARVRDGTVLELSPRSMRALQTTVEDVRDATEDAVDESVGAWRRRDSTTVSVLMLAALAVILLARPDLWESSSGNGVSFAVAAAGALLWGTVRLARQDLTVAAHALMAAGLAWTGALIAAATGSVALSTAGLTLACRAGLCAAAVFAAAVTMTWAAPRLAAWSAGGGVVSLAAASWAAMDLVGRSPDQSVAVVSVLGVLCLGILPRVSLAAGGLAGLDYLVRANGSVEPAAVLASFLRSRALLNGALFTTAALTAAGAVRLEVAGSSVQVALAAMIGGCLLLRARAFSQYLHVLTLVLAGAAALLIQLSADLIAGNPRTSTFVGFLLVATVATVIAHGGKYRPKDVAGARSRRLLDLTESLTVATLMPLLAANLGMLDWVRGLVN